MYLSGSLGWQELHTQSDKFESHLEWGNVSWASESGEGVYYIVSIVYQVLHIVPSGTIASELSKFATGSSCHSTTGHEAGVGLFSVSEGGTWILGLKVRHLFYHDEVKITLYETQEVGLTTPSNITCPAHCAYTQ